MKMGMVEQAAYWDGISNGESVMDFLDALDFPNECLDGEGDGFFDDFDASELGPIPSDDTLTGLFPVPQANFRANSAPKLKPSETGMFQTQSPVSVLETSASCSRGKAVPIKPDMIVPVRTRTKRTRPAKTNPWLLISPICSTAVDSKKTSAAKKKRERKFSQKSNATKDVRNSNWRANDVAADGAVKKCTHCEITKTPQWREGPMGPKTLCNACGVRYRSGRLFPEYRPAASPTFVPSLHSNSHRKVIEMRKKAMGGESEADDSCKKVSKKGFQEASVVVYEPPMSPLPEFVPMSSYLFDCI